MFAADRDLLIYEPDLLGAVRWAGQQTIVNDAGVMTAGGTVLNVPSGQDFDDAGVRAGDVLLLSGVPIEVVSVDGPAMATVSKLRDSATGPPIGLLDGEVGLEVRGWTFRPQIGAVHEQLLTALGLRAGDGEPDAPGESMVVNVREVGRVEALGALHLVYTSAAALVGAESPLWAKAMLYRDRFAAARRGAAAQLDLDGDGEVEAVRRLSLLRFVRG